MSCYFPSRPTPNYDDFPTCPFCSCFLLTDPTDHDHIFCPQCGYSLPLPTTESKKKKGVKKKRKGRKLNGLKQKAKVKQKLPYIHRTR